MGGPGGEGIKRGERGRGTLRKGERPIDIVVVALLHCWPFNVLPALVDVKRTVLGCFHGPHDSCLVPEYM